MGREEAAYTAIFPATLAIAACPVAGRTRFAPITSAVRRAFHFRVVRLPALAPLQGPQSARREDDGEERRHAECDERPDEEEGSAGLGDVPADADTLPHHVDDGDDQSKGATRGG
jgi:hypothetical protein